MKRMFLTRKRKSLMVLISLITIVSCVYSLTLGSTETPTIPFYTLPVSTPSTNTPQIPDNIASEMTPYIPEELTPFIRVTSGAVTRSASSDQLNQTISDEQNDHIDVFTTADFQTFKYKSGDRIVIPLYFRLSSSNKESTDIIIDTKNLDVLNCYIVLGQDKGSIRINDYISYSSTGTITLEKDVFVPITMAIEIPDGLWPYDREKIVQFNLYGIDSTVPFVFQFGGEIDV